MPLFCSPRHRTSTLERTYQGASWDGPNTAQLEECYIRAQARVRDGSAVLRTPTNYPRQRGRMANNVGRRFRGRLESMRRLRIYQPCGWCFRTTHRTADCPRKGAAALALHRHSIRLGPNLRTASPTASIAAASTPVRSTAPESAPRTAAGPAAASVMPDFAVNDHVLFNVETGTRGPLREEGTVVHGMFQDDFDSEWFVTVNFDNFGLRNVPPESLTPPVECGS